MNPLVEGLLEATDDICRMGVPGTVDADRVQAIARSACVKIIALYAMHGTPRFDHLLKITADEAALALEFLATVEVEVCHVNDAENAGGLACGGSPPAFNNSRPNAGSVTPLPYAREGDDEP